MERKKGVVEICYPVVLKIYKKMHLWKIPVPGKDRVKTDLSRLYPGENQEERQFGSFGVHNIAAPER